MKAGKKSNAEAQRGGEAERTDRWPLVRLGDVCEVINGMWKGVKPPFKNVGIIRSTNFTKQCEFSIKNTVFIDVEEKKFYSRRLQVGDLVVERSGGAPGLPVGRCVYIDALDGEYSVSNFTSILRVNNQKFLDPKYLWRYLIALYYQRATEGIQSNTTGIHNLDFKAYLNFHVPLPPLATQRAIVARLDSALARAGALEKRFAAIAKNAELSFKVALNEEIGKVDGKKARLGNVFRFIDYRGMTPTKTETGIPLITAKNIRFGYMDYHEQFFISKSDYATRQTRGIAHKGDILFTTEAPLGYVAIADKEVFSTGQRIITFQWPNDTETHDNRYFLYYFMSDRFQSQIRANASGATAQGIKASRLVNLLVIVPPLSVQRAIVSRLDAARKRADGIAALARQAAEAAANLKKALLKEAFE